MGGTGAKAAEHVRARPPAQGSLRRSLQANRGRLGGATVLFAGHQVAEALVPVVIGAVIDRAVTTQDGAALGRWLVLLAVLFCGLSFAWRFADRGVQRVIRATDHSLRVDATTKILHPRRSDATGRLPGELLSVATSDTERVGFAHMAFGGMVGAFAALAVAAVVLVRISVPLGLLVLLGLPPLLLGLERLARPLERRSGLEQEAAAGAAAVAGDVLRGLRVIKGIGAEQAAAERYRRASRASLSATVRAAAYQSAHEGVTMAVNGLFLALVALVAGRMAADGRISIGDAVAAIGLTQFLVGPMTRLAWSFGAASRGRASAARVDELLDARPVLLGEGPVPAEVVVALRDVVAPGLAGVCFEIGSGELVGVVSSPLAARSLVDLLALEELADSGSVTIGGQDIGAADPDAVRRAVLVSSHDSDLFEGTLEGNVTVRAAGRPDAAMRAAAVDDVIAVLPDGPASVLAARGSSLSGGQRQRVALARALAADPEVLVLHDPTSAVDAVTEQRIADGLRALRTGRTTILVTTSVPLLAAVGRVIVIDGVVIADATHAELLGNARYRDLVLE